MTCVNEVMDFCVDRKLVKMVDQLYGEALEESYAFQNPGSVNHLSEALELEGGDLSLMRGLHGYGSQCGTLSL